MPESSSVWMKSWQLTRRAYYGTYVGVSLLSMALLFGNGFVCMREEDLVCIAEKCAAQQVKCSHMQGFARTEMCCYTKNLPCHIRFWYCILSWFNLGFTSSEKFLRHDFW